MRPIFSTACSSLVSAQPGLREQCRGGRSRLETLKSRARHLCHQSKQQLRPPPPNDLPAFGDPPQIFAGKHKGCESFPEAWVLALPQLLLQSKEAAHKSCSLHPSSPCELTDVSLKTSLSVASKQCKERKQVTETSPGPVNGQT